MCSQLLLPPLAPVRENQKRRHFKWGNVDLSDSGSSPHHQSSVWKPSHAPHGRLNKLHNQSVNTAIELWRKWAVGHRRRHSLLVLLLSLLFSERITVSHSLTEGHSPVFTQLWMQFQLLISISYTFAWITCTLLFCYMNHSPDKEAVNQECIHTLYFQLNSNSLWGAYITYCLSGCLLISHLYEQS